MIWSTTRRIVSWSGGRPIRKRRCSRCRRGPGRAGRGRRPRGARRGPGPARTPGVRRRPSGRRPLAERGGELGVPADGRQHAGEGGDRAVVGEAAHAAEGREQVAAQAAGVRDLGLALLRDQGVDDQRHLAVPAAVERRLRGAGRGGDGVHGEAVVADLLEHLQGGVEDLLLAVALDAGTGAFRRGCGRRGGGRAGSRWVLFTRMKRNGFVSSDRTTTGPDETIPFHRKFFQNFSASPRRDNSRATRFHSRRPRSR